MTDASPESLLAQLAGQANSASSDTWATTATSEPRHAAVAEKKDEQLDQLLERIRAVANPAEAWPQAAAAAPAEHRRKDEFMPIEPQSFTEAQLTSSAVEGLILKLLLSRGDTSGRSISDHVKLPFRLLDELLAELKHDQLVVHKGSAPMNDYIYQLTDVGRERGRRLADHCTYFGCRRVVLTEYIEAVKVQSLTKQHPTVAALARGLRGSADQSAHAPPSGTGHQLGARHVPVRRPGNGKTSIAERITKAFGQTIWIPRAIGVDGEIIRLYDPNGHELMPLETSNGLLDQNRIDKRWVRIRRPTIIVGGELTMDSLEVTLNTSTGISEAPVQLKSNCGTLVIDDFGRQKMSTDELLNRWIVPLEKRHDYLNLANGKKIEVPFDQLVIFSTNLEPKQLVDDAFLRRIPYKIEVIDPSEEEFRGLFKMMAPKLDFEYDDEVISYLIEKHYRAVNRPMRCCQPARLADAGPQHVPL